MPTLPPVRRAASAVAVAAALSVPLLPVAAQADAGTRTVVGELVQAWPETRHDEHPEEDAASQPLTWVETAEGDAVRVPTEDVAGVPVGATVELTVGAEVADEAADEGYDPALDVLESSVVGTAAPVAPPARPVSNEVTVVLVAPAGAAPDAVRPADVAAAVDGPVADFWSEQTGGAVRLGVASSHDWVTTTAGCGDPTAMWAEAAAASGFQAGPGRHLLVYVTSAAAECPYGLAEVGALLASGGRAYVREVMPSLIAHELGHNFGLGHSSALHCDDGTEGGGCRTAAYRDHYDVMGASWDQIGSLNVVQAGQLGLLAPQTLRSVPADGRTTTVELAPLSGIAGVRAVRLVAGDGADYWLELRSPAARDGWLGTDADRFGLESGVLLRRTGGWPDTSLLLDPTPTAGRRGDLRVALPADVALPLGGGRFTVTVRSVRPEGATVEIRSTATRTAPAPAPADAPAAPDVLPADGGQGGAPVTAGRAPAPAAEPAPPAAALAGAPAASVEVAAPAQPAITPTSDIRSLAVPAGAGALIGASGWLLGRRLRRMRSSRAVLLRR